MNQKMKSSHLNPESPFFQTETIWNIELNNKGDAIHTLFINVLNPEHRHSVGSLSFDLPTAGIYTNFVTKIDGVSLETGTGYRNDSKRYTLPLTNLQPERAITQVIISFRHQRATIRLEDLTLAIWSFTLRLQGSVTMNVTLPPLHGIQRVFTWLVRMIEGKEPYYGIHQLDLPPVTLRAQEIDERLGTIKYLLEDGMITPGFAFRSYSRITFYAVAIALASLAIALIKILAEIL